MSNDSAFFLNVTFVYLMLTTAVMTSPLANLNAYLINICYFDFIIKLLVVIGPCASICTDHIPTMAKRTKIECVVLWSNNILVAHTNGNPIRVTLFYLEMECFIRCPFFKIGLHDRKLVPWSILWLDMIVSDKFDVVMLESRGEFVFRRCFPDIRLVYRLL